MPKMTSEIRRRKPEIQAPTPVASQQSKEVDAQHEYNDGDISVNLALFRVFFGLCFAAHIYTYISQQLADAMFGYPSFNFRYSWIPEFVQPAALPTLKLLLLGLLAGGILLSFGMLYRLVSFFLVAGYGYFYFFEKAFFINHHYLIFLLLVLFLLTDAYRKGPNDSPLPRWHLRAFQLLFSIVYFYAGLAKINRDWLVRGQPLLTWFFVGGGVTSHHVPFLGKFWERFVVLVPAAAPHLPFVARALSWAAMLVDLLVGGLMLAAVSVKSRPIVRGLLLSILLAFHIANAALFTIGVFPYLMIASTVLWLDISHEFPRISRSNRENKPASERHHRGRGCRAVDTLRYVLVAVFIALQVIIPLRPYLLSTDPDWTNEGRPFSWRMMLHQEETLVRFVAVPDIDVDTAANAIVYSPADAAVHAPEHLSLNLYQRTQMKHDPVMVRDYAMYVAVDAQSRHGFKTRPHVYVDIWRSLNGRCFQRWIRPDVDMASPAAANDYSALLGHEMWMIPRYHEMNTDENVAVIDALRSQYAAEGYEMACFADVPYTWLHVFLRIEPPTEGQTAEPLYPWEATFAPFAAELFIEVLKGEVWVEMLVRNSTGHEVFASTQLKPGTRAAVPFGEYHRVVVKGEEEGCWAYVYRGLRPGESIAKALHMD